MLLSPVLLIAAAAAAPALAFPTLPVAAPAPTAVEDWTTHFELMEETALKVDPTDWCLDNTDWVEQEKARAQTWYYHGGANQRWWVWQRTGNAEGVHEGTATFRLQRKNTDLCLHFYHDKILQDSVPHREMDLQLAACADATEFFWDNKNICAFHVMGVARYCIELKGVKTYVTDGVRLTINSVGKHRLPWVKFDAKNARPTSGNRG